MARVGILIILASSCPALSGCGTSANLVGVGLVGVTPDADYGKPYGGVLVCCQRASTLVDGKYPGVECPPWLYRLITVPSLAIDFPLSAAADTLTLPLTIPFSLECRREGRKEMDSVPNSSPNCGAAIDPPIQPASP
jgi:hypothetical protein